ncbi:MAG TPA: 4Fe-4S dicluster domain-containing protein [Syntrophorhabdales bacterium]|nr:4Fe-4S dicluster domain-containing protein [Syntrophorhabdales bacterium]
MKSPDAPSSKPTVRQERCSKVRFSSAQCDRCVAGCPTDSIRIIYPDLAIDDTCSGCGFCVALCPNEVFSFPGESPIRFANDEEKPGPLYCSGLFATGRAPARILPPSVIPCLGSISTAFILARVLQDSKPLQVVTGSCETCLMKVGKNSYRQREREIQSLFDYLGIGFSPVIVSTASAAEREEASKQYEIFRASQEESKALSRRDFFKHLRGSAATRRSRPAGNAARSGDIESEQRGPTKEKRTLVALFRRYAGRVAGENGAVPAFIEVEADENCSGCGACASLCPTGALRLDEGPSTVRLQWTPAYCSNCNLCFDVCARKALHWLPCLDAGRIANESTSTLKAFQRHLCQECGNRFLSSGPKARCGDCSKTENLMDALSMMIYGEERRTAS